MFYPEKIKGAVDITHAVCVLAVPGECLGTFCGNSDFSFAYNNFL